MKGGNGMGAWLILLNDIAAIYLGYRLTRDGAFDRKPKRRYRAYRA